MWSPRGINSVLLGVVRWCRTVGTLFRLCLPLTMLRRQPEATRVYTELRSCTRGLGLLGGRRAGGEEGAAAGRPARRRSRAGMEA